MKPLLDDRGGRLVSRRHVQIENRDGRLRVKELGSSNGTTIRRADGTTGPLQAGSTIVVGVEDRVSLAGQLDLQLSGRRWPRARFVHVTVTSAPSATRVVR